MCRGIRNFHHRSDCETNTYLSHKGIQRKSAVATQELHHSPAGDNSTRVFLVRFWADDLQATSWFLFLRSVYKNNQRSGYIWESQVLVPTALWRSSSNTTFFSLNIMQKFVKGEGEVIFIPHDQTHEDHSSFPHETWIKSKRRLQEIRALRLHFIHVNDNPAIRPFHIHHVKTGGDFPKYTYQDPEEKG